ncbi:DnaJ-like protein xdj1 [Rhinocladiella similis]
MNGAPDAAEEIDLYEILGVPKDASQADIRKAYRKKALQHHPDKVAPEEREESEARFKAASQAYEILYDDEKRHLYDAHGMAAFNGGGPGGMGAEVNMEDILNMFGMGGGIPGMGGMPGMGGGGGRRKMRRSPDENQKYEVTLEDLYKGKTVKFSSTKNVICSKCSGSGGIDKAKPKECSACKGQGVKQILSQVGPGMLTQRMVECGACEGTGEVWNPKDKCKKCKGKKVTEERKQLELYIPRGAREGDQIRLEGEADQIPGADETGDIIFHLVEQPHDVFQRTGNDLSAKLEITLAEALAGFHRVVVKHLDGRGIELNHPQIPGQILRPGEVLKVPGEGMPLKRSDAKGDLYLVVEVVFPEDGYFTDPAALESLQKILPGPPPAIEVEEADEVPFEVADIDDIGGQEAGNPWEDDDDGPQQAQCQTQ